MLKNQHSFIFHHQKYYGKVVQESIYFVVICENFTNKKCTSKSGNPSFSFFLFPFWEIFSVFFYTPTTMVTGPENTYDTIDLEGGVSTALQLRGYTMWLYHLSVFDRTDSHIPMHPSALPSI